MDITGINVDPSSYPGINKVINSFKVKKSIEQEKTKVEEKKNDSTPELLADIVTGLIVIGIVILLIRQTRKKEMTNN